MTAEQCVACLDGSRCGKPVCNCMCHYSIERLRKELVNAWCDTRNQLILRREEEDKNSDLRDQLVEREAEIARLTYNKPLLENEIGDLKMKLEASESREQRLREALQHFVESYTETEWTPLDWTELDKACAEAEGVLNPSPAKEEV